MAKYKITDGVSLRRALVDFHNELLTIGLDESCFFRCKLVFSELASNVVKHDSAGEIEMISFEEKVEIVLSSGTAFIFPQESKCSTVYEESGRGLFLIDSVCHSRENTDNGVKIVVIRNK